MRSREKKKIDQAKMPDKIYNQNKNPTSTDSLLECKNLHKGF